MDRHLHHKGASVSGMSNTDFEHLQAIGEIQSLPREEVSDLSELQRMQAEKDMPSPDNSELERFSN